MQLWGASCTGLGIICLFDYASNCRRGQSGCRFSSCVQDLEISRFTIVLLHDGHDPGIGLVAVRFLLFNSFQPFRNLIFDSRGNILCRVKLVVASLPLPSFGLALSPFTKLIVMLLFKQIIFCFGVVSKGYSTGSVAFIGFKVGNVCVYLLEGCV